MPDSFTNQKSELIYQKQRFESQDSSGDSDQSYQSSLESNDSQDLDKINYFKEEMARFFINYPELANKKLLESNKSIENQGQASHNRYWEAITEQIVSDSKEQQPYLESLAKKISLYKYKTEGTNLASLIVKNSDTLLKQIAQEADRNRMESLKSNQDLKKDLKDIYENQNPYLSWRKRRQIQQKTGINPAQEEQKSKSFYRGTIRTNSKNSHSLNKFIGSLNKSAKMYRKPLHKSSSCKTNQYGSRPSSGRKTTRRNAGQLRPVVSKELKTQGGIENYLNNYEPTTQSARQLKQEIQNCPKPVEQHAIKKIIINFLVKEKNRLDLQVHEKPTFSQKMQKIFNQDCKQLLIFYPTKMQARSNTQNDSRVTEINETNCCQQYTQLLSLISEGPLMKYWQQIQQNKL